MVRVLTNQLGLVLLLLTLQPAIAQKTKSFRNYWLTSISNVVKQIEKTKYNEWKAANS